MRSKTQYDQQIKLYQMGWISAS